MTTEDRLARLETLVLALGEIAEQHEDLLTRLVATQQEQAAASSSMALALQSIDLRLGRIETYLRERPTNGGAHL